MRNKIIPAICAVCFIIVILMFCGLLVPVNYILTRYDTDNSVNTGFLEPRELAPERWFEITQTSYDSGGSVSQYCLKKELSSKFYISFLEHGSDNQSVVLQTLKGSGNGFTSYNDYVSSNSLTDAYTRGHYYTNDAGDFTTISVHSGGVLGTKKEEIHKLSFFYNSTGNLSKQVLLLPDGTRYYRVYEYGDNGDLIGHKDYNNFDVLQQYGVYKYSGQTCEQTYYDGDRNKLGTKTETYTWFDQISKVEEYDADGILRSVCNFSYNPFKLIYGIRGVFVVMLAIALSISIYWGSSTILARKSSWNTDGSNLRNKESGGSLH